INRAGQGDEGQISVSDFERKVIKGIKDARTPLGYLTAEYGYGKTSTALYLWKRAEENNVLAVPPFQLLHLPNLIEATHGWVHYQFSLKRPDLLERLEELYTGVTNRSLEQLSRQRQISVATLTDMKKQGLLNLEVQPTEYVQYFEEVTRLVLEAGFDGLLILPDEIQQYIEPRQRTSDTPLQPLFNLIQGIATREGRLNFGIIFVIGLKEVGYIRDVRNDLLHRLKTYHIDLTNVFDIEFSSRLWKQLAREFQFKEIVDEIVDPSALVSLGEIASRTDLSDGPRTVINTFKRMVQRFQAYPDIPYSPIDLIDDFISGALQFSGNEQITRITRSVLQSGVVQNNPEVYERAVKLAAAFPVNGASYKIQQQYGVEEALGHLMQVGIGDLVIAVGAPENGGMTLLGLHSGVQQTDWITQTIRQFRRNYGEVQIESVRRARVFFEEVLKEIFKGWKLIDEYEDNMVRNRSLIFEGHFTPLTNRFPNRKVQVRILWEDEEVKDATTYGDVVLDFYLSRYASHASEERNSAHDPIKIIATPNQYLAQIPLNLMYFSIDALNPQISQWLKDVWSPYDLSPYVLMNIMQMLMEQDAITEKDKTAITRLFLPEVRRDVVRFLFNEVLGASINGGKQERIIEHLVERLLVARYPEYKTLMGVNQWQKNLQRYMNALQLIDNPYQRQGEIEVDGTKEELATKFTLKSTTFDNFIDNYPDLIKVEQKWTKDSNGTVRFILHDLERKIRIWLRNSKEITPSSVAQSQVIHEIDQGEVYRMARELGYQDDEIEQIISLMKIRGLVETYKNIKIREVPTTTADLDSFASRLFEFERAILELTHEMMNNQQLKGFQEELEKLKKHLELERQKRTSDPQQVHKLTRHLTNQVERLDTFFSDQRSQLLKDIDRVKRSRVAMRDQDLRLLEQDIQGTVNYTAQVNFLRNALFNDANKMKSEANSISQTIDDLSIQSTEGSLTYQTFVKLQQQLNKVEQEQSIIIGKVNQFKERLEHFKGWKNLVDRGSEILREIQMMGEMALEQSYQFEALSSDIRSEISSKGHQDRLTALPNHVIYSGQMSDIRSVVDKMRDVATDEFAQLQKRYFALLMQGALFKREQVGTPISFNISDPADSKRLLWDRVHTLVIELHQKLQSIYSKELENAEAILQKPALYQDIDVGQEEIRSAGSEIIKLVQEQLGLLARLAEHVKDRKTIEDISLKDDSGQFNQLITYLSETRSVYNEVRKRNDQLTQDLQSIQLSEEEEKILGYLSTDEHSNQEVELTNWIQSSKISQEQSEQFWNIIRGLYDKHRIRITVSRVRK
ncbi:MAG: hypothetical protein ACOYLB_16140, partial [Phototrophicaceae bacterium]